MLRKCLQGYRLSFFFVFHFSFPRDIFTCFNRQMYQPLNRCLPACVVCVCTGDIYKTVFVSSALMPAPSVEVIYFLKEDSLGSSLLYAEQKQD